MRKIDIRERVYALDRRLQAKRDTPAQQADERARLIEACRVAGDHVPATVWLGTDLGVAEICEFCGRQEKATNQQVARNLSIG